MQDKLEVPKMRERYAMVNMSTMQVVRLNRCYEVVMPDDTTVSFIRLPKVISCQGIDYIMLDTEQKEYRKDDVSRLHVMLKYPYIVHKGEHVVARYNTLEEICLAHGICYQIDGIENVRMSLRIKGLRLELSSTKHRKLLCTATNSNTGDVIGPVTIKVIAKKLGRSSACIGMYLPGRRMSSKTVDGYTIAYAK